MLRCDELWFNPLCDDLQDFALLDLLLSTLLAPSLGASFSAATHRLANLRELTIKVCAPRRRACVDNLPHLKKELQIFFFNLG